jgi:hypothetical protein
MPLKSMVLVTLLVVSACAEVPRQETDVAASAAPLDASGIEAATPQTTTARARETCAEKLPPSCDQDTWVAHQELLQRECAAAYSECYGSDHRSGFFSGPCKAEKECVAACGCIDSACLARCPRTEACLHCKQNVIDPCERPWPLVCKVIYPRPVM